MIQLYRYYSYLRPIGPGTFPKDGAYGIVNYDYRTHVPEINGNAWGYILYERKLSEKECADYDLIPGTKTLER